MKLYFLSICFLVFCSVKAQKNLFDISKTHVSEQYTGSVLYVNQNSINIAILSKKSKFDFKIPIDNEELFLEVEEVKLFSDDFSFRFSSGKSYKYDLGRFYRGKIAGEDASTVTVSIFENELNISFTRNGNTYFIEKLPASNDQRTRNAYLLYNATSQHYNGDFCFMQDDFGTYTKEELENSSTRANGKCVGIYLEVDNDIFNNKGGVQPTINFVTGIFNQVAAIYANEDITTELSEVLVWDTPSPYTSTNASSSLTQFQNNINDFNGDLGGLLTYKVSGGIAAGFSGLCNSNRDQSLCVSGINNSFQSFPSYSWSVMVVTHEFGHIFGSRHTHACVWNGNNTAIDGCAGQVEGACSVPGFPTAGGTIMSYCHLQNVGINFNQGFGEQPGNVIRNRVANATCLVNCDGDDPDPNPSGCEMNELTVTIQLDNYPEETSWKLLDSDDNIIADGGTYANQADGSTVIEKICVESGCYVFVIEDAYGDGICCSYGNGSYSLVHSNGSILASGGSFSNEELTEFCVNSTNNDNDCVEIDFNNFSIQSYISQDQGTYELTSNNSILKLSNNAWKSIDINYNFTSNTVIEFDFGSTDEGEIHGLGVDDNTDDLSPNTTFKLLGTQNWGITNYDNYDNLGLWKSYSIPAGEFITGEYDRVVFLCDDDQNGAGNSYFRNIRIHEGDGCPARYVGFNKLPLQNELDLTAYTNADYSLLNIVLEGDVEYNATFQIYSITGQFFVEEQLYSNQKSTMLQMNINKLPSGTYMLRVQYDALEVPLIEKFNIIR